MIRKLRTFLVALLLVPALFSNASAFTTNSDGVLNPSRPPAATCSIVWNGIVITWEC
jgi:hypothetical protein